MDESEESVTRQEDAPVGAVDRRRFLRIGGGAIVLALTGGVVWLGTGPRGGPVAITEAFAKLDRLQSTPLESTGEWLPYRIFSHVAQSIEMSISGYPLHKSGWFKNTIGSTAYSVFRKTGRMRHKLSEPIPGAPLLEVDGDVDAALQRLRTAFIDFDSFEGELQPHFAYGALSKSQYAAAHVMHLDNHLTEISM